MTLDGISHGFHECDYKDCHGQVAFHCDSCSIMVCRTHAEFRCPDCRGELDELRLN